MPTVKSLQSGDPRRIGRYRLTGRMTGLTGADGSPDIFLGQAADGQQVTVTILSQARAAGPAARDRFIAEASAGGRVTPFCIARFLDAGVDRDRPYLVSEHVPGDSLREVAAQGQLAGAVLAALATGTLTGLAAIHQAGLVHGAFGPDHVILGPDGPRVANFSITPPYGQATPAADLRAWASTVVHAAVGRPPVGPQDLVALPSELRGPVAACLAPDPASRPASRVVLGLLLGRDDPLEDLLAEGARQAGAASRVPAQPGLGAQPGQPAGPPARRVPGLSGARSRKVRWAMACVAGVLAVAAAGWFVAARSGTRGGPAPAVPAVLAGTWAGQVRQTAPVLVVTVRVTLAAGSPGGTIAYPALRCSGLLRAVGGGSGTLTLSQHINVGRRSCADGVITLREHGTGQLRFRFRRTGAPTPAGLLTRAASPPSS